MGRLGRELFPPTWYHSLGDTSVPAPPEFVVFTPYLFGCAFPVSNESLRKLQSMNVGLLASLTLQPLQPGRVGNHLPSQYKNTPPEYADADEDLLDGIDTMKIMHFPVADSRPPTTEIAASFLAEAQKTIAEGKVVCLHCWQGRGRTGTMAAALLMVHLKIPFWQALNIVRADGRGDYVRSMAQLAYLQNKAFPANNTQDPEDIPRITTKPDDPFYTDNTFEGKKRGDNATSQQQVTEEKSD